EKHLRTLASCAEPSTVAVTCEPKQTTLAVDGTEHACPADLQLQPGDYKLTASAEGYRTRTVELTVDAGERIDREVTLSPTSPPAGGGTRSDRAFPAPGPVWYDIVRYTALGAGLGLVAGGIASDASANRRLQKLRSARRAENWSRVDRLRSRADAARTRTAILYTTGTVLTAAGAAFLFIEHPGETDPTSAARRGRFQLTVGPTGLAAHWHW
ncbi:MAG: PEGA domain-containing protein, partial [Bradymonadaceae bacterium]